jgi:hypothetical protein
MCDTFQYGDYRIDAGIFVNLIVITIFRNLCIDMNPHYQIDLMGPPQYHTLLFKHRNSFSRLIKKQASPSHLMIILRISICRPESWVQGWGFKVVSASEGSPSSRSPRHVGVLLQAHQGKAKQEGHQKPGQGCWFGEFVYLCYILVALSARI